jgi:entericidin B
MKLNQFVTLAIVVAALCATGCANTIRGVGKDTASAVNATERAGQDVANAAQ